MADWWEEYWAANRRPGSPVRPGAGVSHNNPRPAGTPSNPLRPGSPVRPGQAPGGGAAAGGGTATGDVPGMFGFFTPGNGTTTLPIPADQQGGQRTGGPVRPDPMAAAAASAAAAMARAGASSAAKAANLDPQIAALRHALQDSFKQSLDQNLGDLEGLLTEQFELLKSGAARRGKELVKTGRGNEQAAAGQAEGSLSNLVRERQDTLTSVLEQGAGQTDALRAMVGAARNWHSNAQEGNRAYFDSMQSLNSSITDLNVDTQSALGNVHTQTESERERLWQDYYNRRSESFTQLGNLYTQQADYLEDAKENKVGGGGGEKKTSAGTAFMDAAKESGLSYTRQKLPDWIRDYKGQEQMKVAQSNTNLGAAIKFAPLKKAEGASSLGRWA